jgi:allophanate hydrolase subunit 2
VLEPQTERFTREGVETFLDHNYAVSAASDRMGMRLTGPPIAHPSTGG